MSLMSPQSMKVTAFKSLIMTAMRTFSINARQALGRSNGHNSTARIAISCCQVIVVVKSRMLRHTGERNMVKVKGSNFKLLPLIIQSANTVLPHSPIWEIAWMQNPKRLKCTSPFTAAKAPNKIQTSTNNRLRVHCCKPMTQAKAKTMATFASFMNCKKATLQK